MIPIPRDPDQRSRLYAERSVVPAIESGDRFVLVTGGSENPWKTWLEGRFPGWTVQYLGNFDGVSVTLFRSGSSHGPQRRLRDLLRDLELQVLGRQLHQCLRIQAEPRMPDIGSLIKSRAEPRCYD